MRPTARPYYNTEREGGGSFFSVEFFNLDNFMLDLDNLKIG